MSRIFEIVSIIHYTGAEIKIIF